MRNLLKDYYEQVNSLLLQFSGFGLLSKETDRFPWFFFDNAKTKDYINKIHVPALNELQKLSVKSVDDQRLTDILNCFDLWKSLDFFQLTPLTTMYTSGFDIITLIDDPRLPSDDKNRAKRLNLAANIIEEYYLKMQAGATQRFTLPKVVCKELVRKLKKAQVKIRLPMHKEVASAGQRCRNAIDSLLEYMTSHYNRVCKSQVGCGQKTYIKCVKFFSGLNIVPDILFASAHKRLLEIKAELHSILGNANLRNIKRTNVVKKSEVVSEFKKSQLEQVPAINNLFYPVCKTPTYDISISDSHTESGVAYCLHATQLDPKNHVIINSEDNVANFEIQSLSLHEGDPGHAFSVQYMVNSGCRWDQICWPMFTGYVEGWALYAEGLADYKTDFDKLGKLAYEMWRVSRVIVEIGMHCRGWSQKHAENFLFANSTLDSNRVKKEILRYISMPGQATTYWLGQQHILNLRRQYGKDIKEFHHKLLSNGVMQLSSLDMLFENKLLPNNK